MGGLAGIVHFEGDPPDPSLLARMSERVAHRGPDGSGTFLEGPVAFAHRRRAVVPSRSEQPLVVDDLVIMMDGWIYDHLKVAMAAGDSREDLTDVQALALAWTRWGSSLTHHLDGEYAAAIWDRKRHVLHLLRDRMGIRPMFWSRSVNRFAFASELPALLALDWVSTDLYGPAISEYLSFKVVHAPRTLLRGIKQLEAAHWLRVSGDKLTTRKYWTLPYAPRRTPTPSGSKVIPKLQGQLEQAVRRRLADGAPAALYLSGGLGSTAIAAAARDLNHSLPTYTVSFADDPNPESPFAGRVAKLLKLDYHEVIVGSGQLAESFDHTIKALGHPVGTPATIVQMLLAQEVKKDARVVLSGNGGEELFGGRMLDAAARGLRRAQAVTKLPAFGRGFAARIVSAGKDGGTPPALFGLAKELGGFNLFNTPDRARLLADPALHRPFVRHEVLVRFYEDLDTDPINAVLHAFLESWLRNDGLVRADRSAAAVGLDVRFPLLDRDLLETAASLPGSFKLRRNRGSIRTRWPLRAMLSGVLPPPLVNRPKRGMPAPMDHWLAGPGRLFLEQRTQKLLQNRRDLFQLDEITRLKQQVSKVPGAAMQLWSLFILDAWLERVDRGWSAQ
ncbi:MAG: asparagine synthase (glutamine-hydrolyzing) [Kiritimatiellia bacterium]|jgi:asparagine synthase (glutamine-hydrolysing)